MAHINDEEGVSQAKLDGILRKVQGLLSKAEHPNTGEAEADAFRAKAEELMQRYRIEESELIIADPGSAIRPIKKTWGVCETNSQYLQEFYSLMVYCCQHAGVRMTYSYGPDIDNDGKRSLLAIMVGYESDVRYAIMLYAIVRMAFSGKMEPKVDPNLSDEDNVYNLRTAGIERQRVAILMGWGGDETGGTNKVTPLYKKACAARGEDPVLTGKGNSVKLYRKSFADAFVSGVYHRLAELRVRSGVGNSGELVLASRKQNVDEAFYTEFPELRPKEMTEEERKAMYAKASRRQRKWVEPKYSELGLRAGRKAANEIDLSNKAGRSLD